MRIYKRGDIYWCQFKGKRQSLGVTDRQAAEAAFRDLQRRHADPSYAQARSVTFELACFEWRQSLATRTKPPSAGTLDMYRYHIDNLLRLLGQGTQLAEIDATAVDGYVTQRRQERVPGKLPDRRRVSAHTVAKELGTLRQILTFALRRGWFHRPLEAVMPADAPPQYEPLNRALTWEQVPLLLAELDAGRAATCAFVIGLGADKCAIARAEFNDFEKDSVLVRGTKNSKRWARVPIVPPFEDLVARARDWLRDHGSFPSWRNNSARDLEAACYRAKLPRVTLRDLRRTHGKVLRARGVSPQLIGAMLRHTDGRMAERVYAQVGASDLGKLVAGQVRQSREPDGAEVIR